MSTHRNENVKNSVNFEKEIALLDKVYIDLVQAIHEKPNNNNIDELRLYIDNIFTTLNGSALRINEVKKSLVENDKFIHETWNPPA